MGGKPVFAEEMTHMPRSPSNFMKDISWVFSGNAMSQLIALMALPLLSRIFSPSDFAVQNLFTQIIAFATVAVTWRYEYFIALPDTNENAQAIKKLVFILALISTVIGTPLLWIFREPLAGWLGEPEMASYLPMALASAALLSVALVLQNMSQRDQNFRLSSLSEVASKIGYVGAALAGGWLIAGPWGLLVAAAIGAVAKISVLAFGQTEQHKQHHPMQNLRAIPRVMHFYRHLAGSMSLSHIFMALTGLIPSVFIAHTHGKEILGQYALVAATLFLPSALLGSAMGQVFYQRAAASWARRENFIGLWMRAVRWLLLIGIPFYFLVWLISDWVYPFVFGATWSMAGAFATLLVPAAFFSFLTSPLDRGCLVVGAWKYVLAWHSFRACSTAAVALLSLFLGWSVEWFLICLSTQMCFCYLIDFWAGHIFASQQPTIGATKIQPI